MPLVVGGNPKIVLDAYVDKSDFDSKVKAIDARLDNLKSGLVAQSNAISQAARTSTMSWTDFRSMYSTVLDVVRVGQAVWDEVGQKYVDNAIKVGDMARSLGTTTEEASRLKEMADDVGISISALTTSFKLAQKDGFEPTIKGLAEMSDQYLALAPGVERTQFLLDRFGKSGEEMGKLLEKGSAAIYANSAAIQQNMIVTQKGYEQARQFQVAQDSLNDSWDAFTYSVAPPLITAVTGVINHYRDIITSLEEMGYWYTVFHQFALDDIADKREQADAALVLAEASDTASGSFESQAEATKAASDAMREMSDSNTSMLGLVKNIQNEMDNYNDKLAETVEKYGEGSEAVLQLEADHQKAMDAIAVQLLITKLSADGLTDAEYKIALGAMEAAGMVNSATVAMANAYNDAANKTVSAQEEVAAVNAMVTEQMRRDHPAIVSILDAINEQYVQGKIKTILYKQEVNNLMLQIRRLDGATAYADIYLRTHGSVPVIPSYSNSLADKFGGGGCFTADTLISMADGRKKPIFEIETGEMVVSWNVEGKHKVFTEVTRTIHHETAHRIIITINGFLQVTPEHPLFINGEWISAGDVKVGDVMILEDGGDLIIDSIHTRDDVIAVYNLHVDADEHNYFADGVLAHNKLAEGGPIPAFGSSTVVERGNPELLTIGNQTWLMMGNKPGQVTALDKAPKGGGGSGGGGGGFSDMDLRKIAKVFAAEMQKATG